MERKVKSTNENRKDANFKFSKNFDLSIYLIHLSLWSVHNTVQSESLWAKEKNIERKQRNTFSVLRSIKFSK